MQLEEWLASKGLSKRHLARSLGQEEAHISRICSKQHFPRMKLAQRIIDFTGGEVTLNELYAKKEQK